ncbi:uncharacterized protein [Asterias amurensis]|uniref:uncharacterized protein n=1 Tax=Asterias amurensis TaxID=7602 RepID=UPI003AB2971D
MSFNITKCCHLCITLKKTKLDHTFTISGQEIQHEKKCKYLGVTITDNLSWNTQAEAVRAKASRSLGLIRRTLGKCSKEVKETAYNTLVRPQLEFATSAWNPNTNRNIRIVESVQRQAARFVMKDYHQESSVSDMLTLLGWDTLHDRRLLHQVEILYKILHGQINITIPPNIILENRRSSRHNQTNQHSHTYRQPFASVDCHLYSPFPRAVRIWNRLPEAAVTATNLNGFQREALPAIRKMELPIPLRTN